MNLKKETVYVPSDNNVVSIAQGYALRALDLQSRLEGYDTRRNFLAEQKRLGITYSQSVLNALHGVPTAQYLDTRTLDELAATEVKVANERSAAEISEKRIIINTWGIRAVGLVATILFALTASCYDHSPSQMPQYTITMAEINQNPMLLLP